MEQEEKFMHRCLGLALRGLGSVAPNPMVGAVIVYDSRIIGEGWHKKFGDAHAEVNCITDAIAKGHEALLRESTLYVNLEPCAHYGKTPPCTDLIIKNEIPKVVIGCSDPFPEVSGKGIIKLRAAGIDTKVGVLEEKCREINKRFFVYNTHLRPYVILKWAQTGNGVFGLENSRLLITDDYTNALVHRWRAEEAAILVGKNTALTDDPLLTNRLWPGPSPVRLVLDLELELPQHLKLFREGSSPVVIFNKSRHDLSPANKIRYYQLDASGSIPAQSLSACVELNLQSLIVEGGAKLITSFITESLWDEARVIISSREHEGKAGLVTAPVLSPPVNEIDQLHLVNDTIHYYLHSNII